MNRLASSLSVAIIGCALFAPTTAFAAGPEACGGIELSAIGECHFEFDGGCSAKCEPLRFQAACDGQCNASLDASCTSSCEGSCQASCEADPGKFDCRAACYADCNATVAAQCDAGDDDCIAYVQADCSATCEAQCEIVAPSASCDAQCNACCSGSCEVDANFDCSLECSAELQGGCEIDCESPSGALFCDGQYIAVQDLPACIQYLVDNFSLELELEASASLTSAMCSYGPAGFGDEHLTLSLLGLGVVFWRRRRQGLER